MTKIALEIKLKNYKPAAGPPPPQITLNKSTLTFTDTEVDSQSVSQTFTVSGTNLTGNIVVTIPGGFIGNQDNSTDNDSPITLVPVSGVVSATTIYCSFSPTLEQEYTANISATSAGATTKNIAVSGTGTAPAVEKYYNVEKVMENIILDATDPENIIYMPAMDGVMALSYDYLNTGTRGILYNCGWPSVSHKKIYYSTDGGHSVDEMTDFPGYPRHACPMIECPDGSLLVIGGDKNTDGNPLEYLGAKEIWRYVKNSTPGLEGTWTKLTSDSGPIFGDRVLHTSSWLGNDNKIYVFCGQFDNSGTPIFNLIRMPANTTTGEDWELVQDLTAWAATNSIAGLSACSVSYDPVNDIAIITGGELYTGAHATNIENDKVIKITNHGATINIVKTGYRTGAYANGCFYDNKHFVQWGAFLNDAHDNAFNTKGLSYTVDGVNWTENYNAPKSRHAGCLFKHGTKMISTTGNLWNDCYSIEALDYPYVVNDLIKNWWLFLPDKPSANTMSAYNQLAAGLNTDGVWNDIEYMFGVPGLLTADNRKIAIKRNKNMVNIDSDEYKTPYPASDTGVQVITDVGNSDHVTIKSTGGYYSGTYINTNFRFDRDKGAMTTYDNALFVFCFSEGNEGADGGIFSGSSGQAIAVKDEGYGGFAGALFNDLTNGLPSPGSTVGLRGIMRFENSTSVKFVYNDTVLLRTSASSLNTDLIDSIERLCAVGARSNREQTFYIRSKSLSDLKVSSLNFRLVEFFGNMNMTIPGS